MIAPSSGAIHAMSGGFTSSPYPPGMSAASSLLPDVKGTIDIYRGGANHVGGENEEEDVAVSSVVAIIANEEEENKMAVHTEDENIAAAAAIAIIANEDISDKKVIQNKVKELNKAPIETTDELDIAVAATIAIIANEEKKEVEDKDKDDDISKEINIFGTLYKVPNPTKNIDQSEWGKIIDSLHLSNLHSNDLDDIKIMIYNQPLCLEQDFPIALSVKCEPMRILINTVIMHAIKNGLIDEDTRKQINILFSKSDWLSGLSQNTIQPINLLFKPEDTITALSGATGTAATTGTSTTATAATGTTGTATTATVTTGTTGTATTGTGTETTGTGTTTAPDNKLIQLIEETSPTKGSVPVITKPIPEVKTSITDKTEYPVSAIGISNEPTIACYAITSLQYLFSIPEFIREILSYTPSSDQNYDHVTRTSVEEIIEKVITESPSLKYDIVGEKQVQVKDALFYIIANLNENSIVFSQANTYTFPKNSKLTESLGRAIMYLMTHFILYLNSVSTKTDRFNTQQDADHFIRFILMMCKFPEIESKFYISTTSTVTYNGITSTTNGDPETSIMLPAQNGTIEELFNNYQNPTKVTITKEGTDVQADKKIDINLNNAYYLHITINRMDNTIPITINPNITLSGRPYKLIGTILRRGTGPKSGHYRYVRMNTQPGVVLDDTPSIVYDDNTVIYHPISKDIKNQIQTECRELLYVFTGKSSGGRIKRVVRRIRHVRDM